MLEKNEIYLGDCLEVMNEIDDKSIDMILCDLPYGTTACKWDVVIPYEPLWEQYKRIIKDNGAICLFGTEPFSSQLRISNLKWYKYDWTWEKDKATNHLNCKRQPMRKTEKISIFYKKQCLYNFQLGNKPIKNIRSETKNRKNVDIYGDMDKESKRVIPINKTYPNEILKFNTDSVGMKGRSFHPTQKPVKLLEYLIKTYTNENELVLDNCIGSGSTAVAAINTNRNYIGIENEEKYFNIANERISSLR